MIGTLAVVVLGFGTAYFLVMVLAGALGGRFERRSLPTAGPEPTQVIFLIACLDEEAVIVDTVRPLLGDERARVVVVDDGSQDRTAALVSSMGSPRVELVSRGLPNARLGKGRALNAGFARIEELVTDERLDPSSVVVCVMDADGRLSPDCLDEVLPLFRDPEVGGAQLIVRIRNRRTWLCRIQDIEFFGLTATTQLGRVRTGTVSLGGNGQFTRLEALQGLGRPPWSASLTEDLDLAISLLADGWRLTSTPQAFVTQEGVERLGPLLRQRTRWLQGHMTCARRLPELWRAPELSNAAVLEVSAYLAAPWLQVLPWSVLFHLGVWQSWLAISSAGWSAFGSSAGARGVGAVLWYLVLFVPSIANGYAYHRRDRSVGRFHALVLGHLTVPSGYISYVACWRALGRLILGRTGWTKTSRAGSPRGAVALVEAS